MPPRPLTESPRVQLLVFADSGWGKTRLAGSSAELPGVRNVLFLRPPVDHIDSILGKHKSKCTEWLLTDWDELEEAYEQLRHERGKYDWVWFDSASAYQEIGLDDLWEDIITEKPHRKRYGMDKGDYWINMQRMGRKLRELVTLSQTGAFNLGVTAWIADMAPSEDEDRPRKLMPFIQGKNMASKTCGYMNIVGFGDFTERGTRVLHFMENDRYYAKTNFDEGKAPGSFAASKYKVLNPTMPKIMSMVEKSGGKVNRKSKARAKATTKRPVRIRR